MKCEAISVPLCVELDSTLVKTNTLAETIVGAVRQNPILIFLIPLWAVRGHAYLWSILVRRFLPDASLLPYMEPALALVRREAAGRPVLLVTGAHERLAQEVASHIGLFSGVFATNGTEHLTGRRKADLLTDKFGVNGFDYVGDSTHDLAVFRNCRQAYVVSSSARLNERLNSESIPVIWIRASSQWSGLWSAMRPRQWVKNILVFVPALLGHRLTDATAVLHSGFACALLCLASSSVYLFNDIVDMEADRGHPTKRSRPLARGTVSIQWGFWAGLVLVSLAVGLGWIEGSSVGLLMALYVASNVIYSVWLKKLLIVDMILLASFYVARVFLGSAATGIGISSWTALFCLFIFFGLAAVKRYAEIHNRAAQLSDFVNRRAYTVEDGAPVVSIGTSSFVGAVIALGLYLGSSDVRRLYHTPDLLWLICPILLGWASRLWILAHRGELGDEDPVAFAFRDRWSYGAAVLSATIFLFAL